VASTDFASCEKFDAKKEGETVDDSQKKVENEDELLKRRAIEIRLMKVAAEKKDLGNEALKRQEYDKAVELYSDGLRCDKNNAVLYANRAQAYIYLKQ